MSNGNDLYLGHKEIMEDYEVSQNNLPDAINAKLLALSLRVKEYEANPTPAEKQSIEHQSAKIGHEIADFCEKDLPEEPVELPTPTPDEVNKDVQNAPAKRSKGIFDYLFN
jgi:hypothetical protein